MKKYILSIIFVTLVIVRPAHSAAEQQAQSEPHVFRARVLRVLEQGVKEGEGETHPYQKVAAVLLSGPDKGKDITMNHGVDFVMLPFLQVKEGDKVVVSQPNPEARPDFYYIIDRYRLNRLAMVGLFFLILAIGFGRKRGLTGMLGLVFTILIIFYGMVPRILSGVNPFVVSMVGCFMIALVSIYLSHGFSKRTSLAVLSTVLTLGLATLLDYFFVSFTGLTGGGTEESFYLQFNAASIDLRGLFLGGILLGVMGVLDDITTAQTAAVEEIHRADSRLPVSELYRRGLSVGREHIASLINTLVLAYVGVSFPLILLFTLNKAQTLWMTLNSSFISEEIIRTLVGSTALVLAVPISTAIAAYYFGRKKTSRTREVLIAREKKGGGSGRRIMEEVGCYSDRG